MRRRKGGLMFGSVVVVAAFTVAAVLPAAEVSIGPAESANVASSGERVLRAPEPDGDGSRGTVGAVSWESVAANMQSAQALLASGDVGEATQQRQQAIIDGLDAMIAAAEAASQSQPSASPTEQDPKDNGGGDSTGRDGNSANPNAQESVERHGSDNVERPDAAGPRRTAVEEYWGRLPERVRQQVLQSAGMRPIPKYRDAVEEYFQRLLDARNAEIQQ